MRTERTKREKVEIVKEDEKEETTEEIEDEENILFIKSNLLTRMMYYKLEISPKM